MSSQGTGDGRTTAVATDPADRPAATGPDGEPDRWRWRARVKANPATRKVYRFAVGFVGVFLILLAGATGWLPGPGGIPLALVGLAVLASEFEWAHRLLEWVKDRLRRGRDWMQAKPVWFQRLSVVVTVLLVVGAIYLYLLSLGVPGWLPDQVSNALVRVPGLD
ncbi:PGPGW domain-containing protein [Angustibacter aerolatus]|uniref:TIGR02611 family protein n=1 Tax=Angustibacter aerolatus TaxID=1162965 RepID=A0ABQ6JC80_9ACTN|nr:PGPGW domain-containing protein [Angustibacter aerolatus]GMA85216.1 hypothetical protein GCM10025868_04660 [Angustibacter aerolatus]